MSSSVAGRGWYCGSRDVVLMGRTPFDDFDDADDLTPNDIADRLRIDARSVRRAIARGELVPSRTCGLRVLAVDAAAWWRGQLVAATPAAPPEASRARASAPPSRRLVERFGESPGAMRRERSGPLAELGIRPGPGRSAPGRASLGRRPPFRAAQSSSSTWVVCSEAVEDCATSAAIRFYPSQW